MTTPMSKHHQKTYDAVFQHPLAHDLPRLDVTAMLGAVAEVHEEPNGNLKATRNGHSLVIHASQDKNITGTDELMKIRHFLERSDGAVTKAAPDCGHLLVVIDHREARIYRTEMHGAVPHRITPLDPHGFGRHLHNVEDDADGQRRPERRSYYDAIAKTLSTAKGILLFGGGTGASSAMEQLLAVLHKDYAEVARHVLGSVVVDAQHLTADQLLAQARAFYESTALNPSHK